MYTQWVYFTYFIVYWLYTFLLARNTDPNFISYGTKCRNNNQNLTPNKKFKTKGRNYIMNITNIKTTLFMPDLSNNFEMKNITLRISKKQEQ